jgi:hypothetical protein
LKNIPDVRLQVVLCKFKDEVELHISVHDVMQLHNMRRLDFSKN